MGETPDKKIFSKKERKKQMKAFLEEYGLALFVMIVIILLICMASPLSKAVATALKEIVTKFSAKTTSYFSNIDFPSTITQ